MNIDKNKSFIGILAISPYPIALIMQMYFANQLTVIEVGYFASFALLIALISSATNWGGDRFIISKKEITNKEIDQAFSFELIVGFFVFLFLIIFFNSALDKYFMVNEKNFFWFLLLVCCLYNPLIRSKAILEKRTKFTKAYLPILIANIAGSLVGILFLNLGYGFWSMIIWRTSIFILEILILAFITSYFPRFSVKNLFNRSFLTYCWPIYVGGLISFGATNIDYFLVTSFMGQEKLGFYWMAFSLSGVILILRDITTRIMLPILSMQDSNEMKISIFDDLNGLIQLFSVFSAILVTYWSSYFFNIILGEKWTDSILLFIFLYYAAVFKLSGGLCGALLFSVMKTKVALNSSLIGLLILTPVIYITVKTGVLEYVALGVLLSSILINLIIFETSVKDLCKKGYIYYLSYISINILCLLLVTTFFKETIDQVFYSLLGTIFSILFAIFTSPINNVLKRAISAYRFNT